MRSVKRQVAQNSGFATKARKKLSEGMLVCQRVDFSAGGAHVTAGQPFVAEFDMTVVDVVVQCVDANANGTAQLRTGTTAITDAIICAVDKVIVRAGSIDHAQEDLSAGSTYNVKTNATGDKGIMTIVGVLR